MQFYKIIETEGAGGSIESNLRAWRAASAATKPTYAGWDATLQVQTT